MPQYILPVSNIADWNDLDAFTQGYIEAAFFTECNPDNEELDGAETGDIAPDSLESVIADCKAWQEKNAEILEYVDGAEWNGSKKWGVYNMSDAGRDYWFTRNGHGVGFWDRGLGDVGDTLTEASGRNEVYLYRGDDGKIYFG